jgi:transcription initiation factor TFIIIB Brf1 subunit/transcription initiation factor TFIIB
MNEKNLHIIFTGKKINLSGQVERATIRFLNDMEINKPKPDELAATIYITAIICQERQTQKYLADKFSISTGQIREQYRKIAQKVDNDRLMAYCDDDLYSAIGKK